MKLFLSLFFLIGSTLMAESTFPMPPVKPGETTPGVTVNGLKTTLVKDSIKTIWDDKNHTIFQTEKTQHRTWTFASDGTLLSVSVGSWDPSEEHTIWTLRSTGNGKTVLTETKMATHVAREIGSSQTDYVPTWNHVSPSESNITLNEQIFPQG